MVLKGLVQVYPPLGEYIPFAVEDTAHPALPAGVDHPAAQPPAAAPAPAPAAPAAQ
jgi:hypothetical protein